MSTSIEIERKFLLRNTPVVPWDGWYYIEQRYFLDTDIGKWVRYRAKTNKNTNKTKYYKTIKTRLDEMSYEEYEIVLTKNQLHKETYKRRTKKGEEEKLITKTRFLKKVGEITWEVDAYDNITLVVAEAEIPSREYKLLIPDFIQQNLIREVTGKGYFSNSSLAIPIKS